MFLGKFSIRAFWLRKRICFQKVWLLCVEISPDDGNLDKSNPAGQLNKPTSASVFPAMELHKIANCRVSSTRPITLKNTLYQQQPSAQICFADPSCQSYCQQANSSPVSKLLAVLQALAAVLPALIAVLEALIAVLEALTAVLPALIAALPALAEVLPALTKVVSETWMHYCQQWQHIASTAISIASTDSSIASSDSVLPALAELLSALTAVLSALAEILSAI